MISSESIVKRWAYRNGSAVRDRRSRSRGRATREPWHPHSPSAVEKRHQREGYREDPGPMAQAERGGRARDGRVDADRPIVDLVGCKLDALAGAELLFDLGKPRKEFVDDDAVPGIGIVVRAGSLGVLDEVMPELGIKDVVMTEQRGSGARRKIIPATAMERAIQADQR